MYAFSYLFCYQQETKTKKEQVLRKTIELHPGDYVRLYHHRY